MFIFLTAKRAKISPVAPIKTEIKAFQRQSIQIDFFCGFLYGFFVGIKVFCWYACLIATKKTENNKIINNKVAVILLLVIVAFLLYIHRIVIFIVGNPNSQQRMGYGSNLAIPPAPFWVGSKQIHTKILRPIYQNSKTN